MSRIKHVMIEIKKSVDGLKSIIRQNWRISELKNMGTYLEHTTERIKRKI